jgi:hypothetical protein
MPHHSEQKCGGNDDRTFIDGEYNEPLLTWVDLTPRCSSNLWFVVRHEVDFFLLQPILQTPLLSTQNGDSVDWRARSVFFDHVDNLNAHGHDR